MGAPWQPGSGSGHNGGMRIEEHIDQLAAEGPRLADAAQRAGLDAAVPGCPGWQVRDLVTHVGGVHRARRQAHETAIHRGDAQAACRAAGSFDPALALDGIDEILTGFAARPRALAPGTLRIEPAGDAPWLATLGPRGVTASRAQGQDTPADVTVRGSAADIYLWLWNRPAAVTVTGEAAVADRWQQIRVRWS